MSSFDFPAADAASPWQVLDLQDADLQLQPAFLDQASAAAVFTELMAQVAWEQHRITLFGRAVDSPRLSCWVGDADARYRYSRTEFAPRPWTPLLATLRDRVAAACATKFNSVLCNLYRDGRDSMGAHSDDEPELGVEPLIASLSLGGVRRFQLRHKRERALSLDLDLPSGSLLLMRGGTQRHYRHALPKTARPVAPRINLTFRWIFSRPPRR